MAARRHDPDVEDPDPTGRLPAAIALFSLLCALWIFTRNTVPALAERNALRQSEQELLDRFSQHRDWIARGQAQLEAQRGDGMADPQALVVAIDAMGYTPAELLRRYPETEAQDQGVPGPGTAAATSDGR